MAHDKIESIRTHALKNFDGTVARLSKYLRIPAISCDKAHANDVATLATAIKDDLVALGMQNVRVVKLDDALPMVVAERMNAGPDKPTVLIYGHLDLQPVKGETWDTPPHEPTIRGERLYARGAADDMGGWVSHIAAIESWLAVNDELPVNVKLIIEGEEEIGSPNLERYMDAYPEVFESDIMVLTDCENPSTEIPGLTVSLRGLYEVELVCEALSADVHSGLWGNVAPDVSTSLFALVARLLDDDGRMKHGRVDVPEAWKRAAVDVPLTPEVITSGAHIIDGVSPIPLRGRPAAEWVWRQPAVTVLTTTLPTPDMQKNALRRSASATLSIRLAPGQTKEEMRAILDDVVLSNPPGGVKVSLVEKHASASSWLYAPKGPAFAAADRAYEASWGRKLLSVGVGGSIPFVALFGRRFGDLPLILNGVMDPETSAHGPNESMHLGVFQKAILANVHLLDELSTLPKSNGA